MNKYWEEAWINQQFEQYTKTGVDQAEWRASGRATKANPNKEDGVWWAVEGEKMVDSWIQWRSGEHPLTIWEVQPGKPAIELGLTPIWNDIPVQMHIDRVMVNPDGELIVLDIKTGTRTPSSDLQLAFYAAGMEDILGIRPRYGAYWMARTGQTSELIDLDYFSKDSIIEMVTKFDQARKAELFIPNLSHCIMCGVKDQCKYKRKG
jgi:hypothetical protein